MNYNTRTANKTPHTIKYHNLGDYKRNKIIIRKYIHSIFTQYSCYYILKYIKIFK